MNRALLVMISLDGVLRVRSGFLFCVTFFFMRAVRSLLFGSWKIGVGTGVPRLADSKPAGIVGEFHLMDNNVYLS